MSGQVNVVVIGAGIGGLTAAALLQERGINTVVFEKNDYPGGSCASFSRNGYTFDAGASVFYGFSDNDRSGTLNLHTRIFRKLGVVVETVPDPVQIHYHLPKGFSIEASFDRQQFLASLAMRFPEEKDGIEKFYRELEDVYEILSSLPAGSLEDVAHLASVGGRYPLKTVMLALKTFRSMGKTARRYIRNEELLRFIDIESYSWAVQDALSTPLVNAGICLADRHHGGINYPLGGSGKIPEALCRGLEKFGGNVHYRSEVKEIVVENGEAKGVRLSNGEIVHAQAVITNATVWDTFNRMIPGSRYRVSEDRFLRAPSWFQMFLGIDARVIPAGFNVHHILVDDWKTYDSLGGTIYFSAPTILDPSLAPQGKHIIHAFVTSETTEWECHVRGSAAYRDAKQRYADSLISRTEKILPGLAEAVELKILATPQTHERYLHRHKGSYGALLKPGQNILQKPQNRTPVRNLFATGDSTFPGQGVIAVTYSGVSCASLVARKMGKPLEYL
ncbi:MAG: NAD(P)/FAD-dependent oxidoreductase [Chlorobium sp.]|jgi:prolycopene isomerase|uniref:phytoene desaturase family protein n=1 Tax=Chlorobium sp. TaxID=1095 RepID=UPI001D5079E2|nr:NAD(P)/FAD-dependent oxidoreductase [Chlorobium sp.]MBN1279933.1 FAD-dependent oxidoreductase [Chlorobiaceae bacterium]MCF8217219.1 NAD(P)/FAD-dependent oxidoreductase [Chlorobium sp.]MCF8272077.1 NAD(P)/FAD-dependent oxidoreductase [Chlorobium sp.]MCF8288438.1 NAD(P)/FAD-dependent oxidoreductase [Chlorobium sp.]MCF8292028.1 NAD(P)/FAD-dependent oxidoreductase [Chlorobium sp.]